ncbi:DUF3010 family protein [Halarcobacter ebronensis]|uniref:DUF3010 domain-containing protein n=1 Tax=Halarcobacter ebronensis TaxID=1462615 RepID=A0A4Q1ARS4_9BACT|nr:DUF3010 family protein [Halarcobacter ebronensis]QKF80526.1 DUF3010 domain-containing protein [Halarcobacter ebronensis]RXK08334.1 hypothetical protein CRV07_00580 [Halarcobacter ebronensis]
MNICGIELKSNQAMLVVINENGYLDLKTKKIVLENDEEQNSIREFCNQFLLFLEENAIDAIAIKKRGKKGAFAGGAVTFKMEGLIQLNPLTKVELLSSQTISSFEKRNNIEYPQSLKKYQEQAYLTALSYKDKI